MSSAWSDERPRLESKRRVTTIAIVGLLAALLLAPGAARGTVPARSAPRTAHAPLVPGTRGFHERVVADIPVGPHAWQLGSVQPGCCGENEEAGTVFLGLDDHLYVYDDQYRNVKVIDPHGRLPVRLLPPVPIDEQASDPNSGAADTDGNVYLVGEGQPSNVGCILYALPRGAERWRIVVIPWADARWQAVSPGRAGRTTLLEALPDGDVLLHHIDTPEDAIVAARRGELLCGEPERRSAWPRRLPSGLQLVHRRDRVEYRRGEGPATDSLPSVPGTFLGLTPSGRAYFFTLRDDAILGYDPDGRLEHSMSYPFRSLWKSLRGWTQYMVTSDDAVLAWRVTPRRLLIYRLEPDRRTRPGAR